MKQSLGVVEALFAFSSVVVLLISFSISTNVVEWRMLAVYLLVAAVFARPGPE